MEVGSRGIGSEDSREGGNFPSSSISQDDHSLRSKKSNSSLSSSSSSGDPLQLEFDVNGNVTTGFTSNHEHGSSKHLGWRHSEEDIPVSSMPVNEHLDNESLGSSSARKLHGQMLETCSSNVSDDLVTQSPEVQLMERNGDTGASPATSYRIPSSVFSTNKSNMEWSVASNESLFSIQMGNMSFQGEGLMLGKSGELNKPGECFMLDPSIDYNSNQPPDSQLKKSKPDEDGPKSTDNQPAANQTNESSKKNLNMDNRLCATSQAVETMKEVLLESSDHNKEQVAPRESNYSNSPSHCSHESGASGASTRSFAFPVLAGEVAKSSSAKSNDNAIKKQSPSVKVQPVPESSDPPTQMAEPPKAAPESGLSKWFSCACRCSFCP